MAEVRNKGRIIAVSTLILLVFVGLLFRLYLVQIHPEDWVLKPMESGRILKLETIGSRGRIVDRNGEILAMDLAAYHVCVDPKDIAKNGDAFLVRRILANRFGLEERDLAKTLTDTSRSYARVKKFVPGYELEDFRRSPYGLYYKTVRGNVATNIYLRGVTLEEAPIRNYPKGALMAHVVGFANRAGKGAAGIELVYDELLQGKRGRLVSERDGKRHEIYSRRTEDIKPKDGNNVVLTLDQQLQYVVEKTIERVRDEFGASAVWAIVQQVRTGEILAMASCPTYDLNRYASAPSDWMRNRTISSIYEPGSTMKAATIAIALDKGIVHEDDMIDCEDGCWIYGGRRLRDSHREGLLSVADIIKVSSNIGTAKIALLIGDHPLYDSLRKFGFGNKLKTGLPGEEYGLLWKPAKWSKISATRIGMGHEIGVTALQIISMMSTIANNGMQMNPYVVKEIVAPNGRVIQRFKPKELGRPIAAATAQKMRHLLARVTEKGGTGTKACVEGYTVAGKTGTAQKVRPKSEGGGYYEKRFYSSFAGFLPAENPEISIIVVADDPGTFTKSGRKINYYGGTVCGPAFKEIAEFAVRYLQIPPEGLRIEHMVRPEL